LIEKKDSWASKVTLTGSSKQRPLAILSAASHIVASDDVVAVASNIPNVVDVAAVAL